MARRQPGLMTLGRLRTGSFKVSACTGKCTRNTKKNRKGVRMDRVRMKKRISAAVLILGLLAGSGCTGQEDGEYREERVLDR